MRSITSGSGRWWVVQQIELLGSLAISLDGNAACRTLKMLLDYLTTSMLLGFLGNVVELAIGVVFGASFGALISALRPGVSTVR